MDKLQPMDQVYPWDYLIWTVKQYYTVVLMVKTGLSFLCNAFTAFHLIPLDGNRHNLSLLECAWHYFSQPLHHFIYLVWHTVKRAQRNCWLGVMVSCILLVVSLHYVHLPYAENTATRVTQLGPIGTSFITTVRTDLQLRKNVFILHLMYGMYKLIFFGGGVEGCSNGVATQNPLHSIIWTALPCLVLSSSSLNTVVKYFL